MARWLMKSEPEIFSWDDLVRDGSTQWDGVRNYAARQHLNAMQIGDEAFFYHSGKGPAVVGIMRVTGTGRARRRRGRLGQGPDGAGPAARPVTLKDIKAEPKLAKMELVRQSRLSVSPVRDEEWALILKMAGG